MSYRTTVLGIAAGAIVLAAIYLVSDLAYPFGSLAQPGPALYPLLVGVLLLAGGVGTAAEALTQPDRPVDWPGRPALRRILVLFGSMLGYVVLLQILGFAITAGLLAFAVMAVTTYGSLWVRALIAIAIPLVTWFLFSSLLRLPMPRGIIF